MTASDSAAAVATAAAAATAALHDGMGLQDAGLDLRIVVYAAA